ncbi:MAG: CCA tRNA nucleotidyltransferase [Pseudolabrys sp.]|nr:CCA tRNA nucleotidyltransferase [Pseudolabrys sp.]MBV9953738.1 CCA tRNA nucleotidyltransferase [Pseudolabrys sp.]
MTANLSGAAWLAQGALAKLLAALDGSGEEARVVGGAVRNALLGEPVHEIDIATTAVPEEVIKRVTAAGFKAVPTGIEHGTVTVVGDGMPFEVTTLRRDVETYGRHAKVVFGRDWKADAERRDFTLNALSASRDGAIEDYVGGLADLTARKVRFIGDPAKRIAEDYLRILRFFRFHAWYGKGGLDAPGLAACIQLREGLDQLSRERVRMEMLKLLAAPGAVAALEVMADNGLLGRVIAGVPNIVHVTAMARLEETLTLAPDPLRRLGALAVVVAEDVERLWQKLRLTNVEHARLAGIAEGWWRIGPALSENARRTLLYRLGPALFLDQALLGWARSGAAVQDEEWRKLATLPQRWTAPAFPIKAADLMARGMTQGPALGEALKAAEAAWIAAGFPSDRAALHGIIEKAATPR